jgi:hypothetical protein
MFPVPLLTSSGTVSFRSGVSVGSLGSYPPTRMYTLFPALRMILVGVSCLIPDMLLMVLVIE